MHFFSDIGIPNFIKFTHYKVFGMHIKSPASGYKKNSSQQSTEETSLRHIVFINALLRGSLTSI